MEDKSLFERVISGEYFTEAKQLCSGVFWVITDSRNLSSYKLVFFDVPCDPDGTPIGNHDIPLNSKKGNSYNHKLLWEEEIAGNPSHKPYCRKSYDFYPRGRVIVSNNKADIYLNPNINQSNIIDEIKQKYGLTNHNISSVRVMNDTSTHYKCWMDCYE